MFKSKKVTFIVLIVFLLLSSVLTACGKTITLDVPKNCKIEGSLFSWDKVPNATHYIVYFEGQEYEIQDTSFNINVDDFDEYIVKVKAVDKNKKFVDSAFTQAYKYQKNDVDAPENPTLKTRLSIPKNAIKYVDEYIWDKVNNASHYIVEIIQPDGQSVTEEIYGLKIKLKTNQNGYYKYRVKAIPINDNYRESIYTKYIQYKINEGVIVTNDLLCPNQVWYKDGILYWTRVPYSLGYTVKINGIETITKNEFIKLKLNSKISDVQICANGDGSNYESSKFTEPIRFPLTISSPPANVVLEDNKIKWEEVKGAQGYAVYIDGKEFKTDNLEYDLDYSVDGKHIVTVKAIGKQYFYYNSPMSKELIYSVTNNKLSKYTLDSPVNVLVKDGVLEFAEVKNNNGYQIFINDQVIDVTENTYSLEDLQDGTYFISVIAKGDDENTSNSLRSYEIEYNKNVTKDTLDSISSINYRNAMIDWFKEPYATYEIIINGEKVDNDSNVFKLGDDYPADDYIIKIRVKKDDLVSPYSQEFLIKKPQKLDAPYDITIQGDRLHWKLVDGAEKYKIQVVSYEGEVVKEYTVDSSYCNLGLDDGNYFIKIKSIPAENSKIYLESNYSHEINFRLFDNSLGSENNPFRITSESELLNVLSEYPNSYYVLEKDLDFNLLEFKPVFNKDKPFSGNFDGNHKTISNLKFETYYENIGLFSYTENAIIKNLKIDNVKVNVNSVNDESTDKLNIGIISGYSINSEFTGITIKNVDYNVSSSLLNAGVLVGVNDSPDKISSFINITDTEMTLDADFYNAGILAGFYIGAITNSDIGTADKKVKINIDSRYVKLGGLFGNLNYGIDEEFINYEINSFIEITLNNACENAEIGGFSYKTSVYNNYNFNLNTTVNNLSNLTKTEITGLTYLNDRENGILNNVDIVLNTDIEANDLKVAGYFVNANNINITNSNVELVSTPKTELVNIAGGIITGNCNFTNVNFNVNITDVNVESDNYKSVKYAGIANKLVGDLENCNVTFVCNVENLKNKIMIAGLVNEFKGNTNLLDDSTSNVNSTIKVNNQNENTNSYISASFSTAESSTIKNINFTNIDLNCKANGISYIGGLIAKGKNNNIFNITGNLTNDLLIENTTNNIYFGGLIGKSDDNNLTDVDIKSFVLEIDSKTKQNINIGGLLGYGNGDLENIKLTLNTTIRTNGVKFGGVSSYLKGNVTNLDINLDLDLIANNLNDKNETLLLGGALGEFRGNIENVNCTINTFKVESELNDSQENYIGGLIGKHLNGVAKNITVTQETIDNCYIKNKSTTYYGGVVGFSLANYENVVDENGAIIKNAVTANINMDIFSTRENLYVGGFAGYLRGNLGKSEINGHLKTRLNLRDIYLGGVIGNAQNCVIKNVNSNINLESGIKIDTYNKQTMYIGGLIALSDDNNITSASFTGNILNSNGEIGYIAGLIAKDSYSNISKSFTNTQLDNNYRNETKLLLSPFIAESEATNIKTSYIYFNIDNTLDNINTLCLGGFIAENINEASSINNCYIVSNIKLTEIKDKDADNKAYLGGIVGKPLNTNISNVFIAGKINVEIAEGYECENIGNISANNNCTLNNVIKDYLLKSNIVNDNGTENNENIKKLIIWDNFDLFEDVVWDKNDTYLYPRLKDVSGQEISDATPELKNDNNIITIDAGNESHNLRDYLDVGYDNVFDGYKFVVNEINYDFFKINSEGILSIYKNCDALSVTLVFENNKTIEIFVKITNYSSIEGEGTIINPYKINNIQELTYMQVKNDKAFILNSNIDLSDYEWTSFDFHGHLEGNNKSITNLNKFTNGSYSLFKNIDGAKIVDLKLDVDINETVDGDFGAVALNGTNINKIENIVLTGNINITVNQKGNIGCLFGDINKSSNDMLYIQSKANLTINNSSNMLNIGGIIGNARIKIRESFYKGKMTLNLNYGSYNIGGLFGNVIGSTIKNSFAIPEINITNMQSDINLGGLIGKTNTFVDEENESNNINSNIQNCYSNLILNSEKINGYVGSLIGINDAIIDKVYSSIKTNVETYAFIGNNLNADINNAIYYNNCPAVIKGFSENIIGKSFDELISFDDDNWAAYWEFTENCVPRLILNTDYITNEQNSLTSNDFNIEENYSFDNPNFIINLDELNINTLDNSTGLSKGVFNVYKLVVENNDCLRLYKNNLYFVQHNGSVNVTLYYDGNENGISFVLNLSNVSNAVIDEGNGQDLPFVIKNVDQFEIINQLPNMNYILDCDLEFTDTNIKIENFSGVFDGNNKVIKTVGDALFNEINGGQVKNLVLINNNIELQSTKNNGILANKVINATIENVTVQNYSVSEENQPVLENYSPINKDNFASEIFGGLIGYADNSTITNSKVNANFDIEIDSYYSIGGLIGFANECTITNSFIFNPNSYLSDTSGVNTDSSFIIKTNGYYNKIGGLIGDLSYSTLTLQTDTTLNLKITNNNLENLSGENMFGGLIGCSVKSILNTTIVSENPLNMVNVNIEINKNDGDNANILVGGIIGKSSYDNLSDLKFENINISTKDLDDVNYQSLYIGGLAGNVSDGIVNNVEIKNTININNSSNKLFIGGMFAKGNADIDNSSIEFISNVENNSLDAKTIIGGCSGTLSGSLKNTNIKGQINANTFGNIYSSLGVGQSSAVIINLNINNMNEVVNTDDDKSYINVYSKYKSVYAGGLVSKNDFLVENSISNAIIKYLGNVDYDLQSDDRNTVIGGLIALNNNSICNLEAKGNVDYNYSLNNEILVGENNSNHETFISNGIGINNGMATNLKAESNIDISINNDETKNHTVDFVLYTGGLIAKNTDNVNKLQTDNQNINITNNLYSEYIGGLIGYTNSKVENSIINENSNINVNKNVEFTTSNQDFVYIGGLIGYAKAKTNQILVINSCMNLNTLDINENGIADDVKHIGMFVGYVDASTINYNDVPSNNYNNEESSDDDTEVIDSNIKIIQSYSKYNDNTNYDFIGFMNDVLLSQIYVNNCGKKSAESLKLNTTYVSQDIEINNITYKAWNIDEENGVWNILNNQYPTLK